MGLGIEDAGGFAGQCVFEIQGPRPSSSSMVRVMEPMLLC